MSDYRVELDAYAGPLDLLLYLVKRHEIDLQDIPTAQLTEQYLKHLKVIESIDVDRAGEFLVMAATLVEIKSQMLIPRVAASVEDEESDSESDAPVEDPTDPRFELVQQLLAYKRYKDAAIALEHRHEDWQSRFIAAAKSAAADPDAPGGADEKEFEIDDVDVAVLCEAFSRILDSVGAKPRHEVTYDDTPISLHAADIYDRLQREGPMTLQQIFVGRANRSELIGLFLATLELVRNRQVTVTQDAIGGEVSLTPLPPEAAEADQSQNDEPTDWRDPETGEMQYDWPDEEARQRSEARKARAAARLARMRAGETAEEEEDEDAFGGLDEDDPLKDIEG